MHVADHDVTVLDLAKVRASMAGQDAVIHLAAVNFGVSAEPEVYFGTNLIGTWNAV